MTRSANRLQDFRIRELLTVDALAEKAGLSRFTVHRAEKGFRISPLSEQRLAVALRVPRDVLFPDPAIEATA